MDNEAIRRYIDKVIADSCKAENHTSDVQYEFTIIGKSLIFAIKSRYLRVIRRVIYRLMNNLEKNFGLSFQPIHPYSEIREYNMIRYYDWSPASNGVDPNNAICRYTVFGKPGTLTSSWGNVMSGTGRVHLNKLREAGYDHQEVDDIDLFFEAYKKAYGVDPMDIHLKIHDYWIRMKELRKKGIVDLDEQKFLSDDFKHGCGYWSVCSDHACPCHNDAPVTAGYDPAVYKRMYESCKHVTVDE